ncbi:MAG: CPBP family intramembrane metalloprotease [Bacteroidota bacterium]|nr:CPBP family intramembrane metalloprotease [Bacteroidota bacterium]
MDSTSSNHRKPVLLYLGFLIVFSSVFYTLIIHTGKLGSGFGNYVVGLMWCPGLAGICTTLILKRDLSSLGWQWGKTKYQVWSYLVPLLYALAAYGIIWATGWGKFYNAGFVEQVASSFGFTSLPALVTILLYFLIQGIYGLPRSCASALGEEIGWRGFLVPELYKKHGYVKTSLVVGIIWSLWHYPILLFADYNSGTPAWFGLSCFTVMVVSISFVFTWFRIRSNSIWTAVLLHASHNLFIQSIFSPLTADTGNTKYYIDEFGAVLPVICLVIAIYFWSRRKELTVQESA